MKHLFCCLILLCIGVGCNKKDPIPNQSFVEEFNSLDELAASGWRFINRSQPASVQSWQVGSSSNSLTSYSPQGSFTGFITTSVDATTANEGTISDWAISPKITVQNGDKIVFYTKALTYPDRNELRDYVNRLQLRLNLKNDTTNVGSGASVGDFDILLLDINRDYEEYTSDPATYSPTAYPADWTRFEATIINLASPTRGRFAFRYFLEGGGRAGRGSEVAIDSVAYVGQ